MVFMRKKSEQRAIAAAKDGREWFAITVKDSKLYYSEKTGFGGNLAEATWYTSEESARGHLRLLQHGLCDVPLQLVRFYVVSCQKV